MFTPWRARCGISAYSHHLVAALRALPEIADARIVEAPANAVRGALDALRHFGEDTRRFHTLGDQMNGGADVAHVQHQYFFFGGVAPHKNHCRAFLDAVQDPLVMTVHEIARPKRDASPPEAWMIAAVNRANFLHPAIRRWIVHTESDRQELAALGVPAERIHRVTHGVPDALPMPDGAMAKRALGLEGRRVVTLFGYLAAKKGHCLALAALPQLPPDVTLLFAGDQHPDDHTDYVPNLRAEIERRGLSGRVRITGYLPDEQIPSVMAATDAAIAPFAHSSGSGSLANLLAYARPVVASDIAPHQEINRETPACLSLFRSGDADDLAAQVRAVLDNDDRRLPLEAAARAYAARHSYAQMARETLAVYRQV
jgi:glycosyltransferase involved in cell wall biosynthesis